MNIIKFLLLKLRFIYNILSAFFKNKFRKFYIFILRCLVNFVNRFIYYRDLLFKYLNKNNNKLIAILLNILLRVICSTVFILCVWLIL